MKGKNIFEAGKTAYHCGKCTANVLFYDKHPQKCPCCRSTDFKQLTEQELEQLFKEDKKQVHVIIGIYSGVLDDIEVFYNDEEATKHEKTLCNEYDIPFDDIERQKYYDSDGEHEIKHIITKVH